MYESHALVDERPHHRQVEDAQAWEAQHGYVETLPVEQREFEKPPVFNYAYRTMNEVLIPQHHRMVAEMAIMGLTLDEIAAERGLSPKTIKRILEHHPVYQFVLANTTRAKIKAHERKEEKVEQRRRMSDKGADMIENILDGTLAKPTTAHVQAAKIAMSMSPERVWEPEIATAGAEIPHDTSTLDALWARHEEKKRRSSAINVASSEKIDKVTEIPHDSGGEEKMP